MKCAILLKQLHTTRIASYSWANNSLVMKSTEIWLYGFSRIALGISFSTGVSLQFLYLWYVSYLSIYLPTSFIISGNQLCHLPSPSVLFYWDVIVQSYYFPSEFSFWYIYPFFLHYYPIFYFPFFIF